MNFSSVSQEWTVCDEDVEPQTLLKTFLQSIVSRLPKDTSGHAKLYAEFEGGAAFCSATLIPDDLNIRTTGKFLQGDIRIGATLLFEDIKQQTLVRALETAEHDVENELKCKMLAYRGEYYGR